MRVLGFLLATAKSKTKPGTHYICSQFDTVALSPHGFHTVLILPRELFRVPKRPMNGRMNLSNALCG